MSIAGGNPARLRPGQTVYSGKRPSYIILSSPYTCAQFRIVVVHFFVASKVARYKAFRSEVSLGNTLL